MRSMIQLNSAKKRLTQRQESLTALELWPRASRRYHQAAGAKCQLAGVQDIGGATIQHDPLPVSKDFLRLFFFFE